MVPSDRTDAERCRDAVVLVASCETAAPAGYRTAFVGAEVLTGRLPGFNFREAQRCEFAKARDWELLVVVAAELRALSAGVSRWH